jgi:hypothetical protein
MAADREPTAFAAWQTVLRDPGRALAVAGLLVLVLARGAAADSDGYFCIATGYLAYELREWSAPERTHVLKVVRVGGTDGVSDPTTLPLHDFQVHGLRCDPDRIVVLGWDRRYTIVLPSEGPPRMVRVEPRPAAPVPAEYRADSLTDSRRSRSIRIPSGRHGRIYDLQITHREVGWTPSGQGGVIHHETTSTLIERDLTGMVVTQKRIHAGVAKETVD